VVAKVVSSLAIHKTDKGFVAVNIPDEKTLKTILRGWQKKIHKPFLPGEGFSIQAYVPGMLELFIGAKRDPQLGAYILFGLGGIFVNQIRDTTVYPLPISSSQARQMISQGNVGAIKASARGKKLPWNQVIACITGISQMFAKHPELVECDCNPVMITKDRVVLPDIRLMRVS
jgi:acetyltransferase